MKCLLWHGEVNKISGYGVMYRYGKKQRAHRVIWEEVFGPIPTGLCVLHKCDNRRCIQPAHLFLGTQGDNVADMMSKGRHKKSGAPGEQHPGVKLTTAQILAIRADPRHQRQIAADYGISQAHVSRIRIGKGWKHLPGPVRGRGGPRLTVQQVLAIRADTRPLKELAAAYGIDRGYICRVRNRRSWRHVP